MTYRIEYLNWDGSVQYLAGFQIANSHDGAIEEFCKRRGWTNDGRLAARVCDRYKVAVADAKDTI